MAEEFVYPDLQYLEDLFALVAKSNLMYCEIGPIKLQMAPPAMRPQAISTVPAVEEPKSYVPPKVREGVAALFKNGDLPRFPGQPGPPDKG